MPRTPKSRNCVKAAGEKLLSLTRTSERRPSGSLGPKVIPSTLSSGIPSTSRFKSSVFHGLDRPEQGREAVEAVDVVRTGERDLVELDRVAGVRRADRERPLHREQELVVQRQQLDEAVDRELRRGHGGSAIGSVRRYWRSSTPLLEVVAEDPRRAAAPDGGGGPSWTSAPRCGEEGGRSAASPRSRSRDSGARRACRRRSARRRRAGAGTESWRPSSPNSRTQGRSGGSRSPRR